MFMLDDWRCTRCLHLVEFRCVCKEQPAMLVASAERFCWKTSSSSDLTESSISSTVIPDQAISWGWTECKAKFITIGLVEPVQWWTTASIPLGVYQYIDQL